MTGVHGGVTGNSKSVTGAWNATSRHGSVTGAWLDQFMVYYNAFFGMGS